MNIESVWPTVTAYVSAAVTTTVGMIHSAGGVALAGLAIGVATFATNWYFKRQMLKMQREIRDEYMRRRPSETVPAPLGLDG